MNIRITLCWALGIVGFMQAEKTFNFEHVGEIPFDQLRRELKEGKEIKKSDEASVLSTFLAEKKKRELEA